MEMITYTYLFLGKWSKGSVILHTSNYVEPHPLLSKYQLNVIIFVKKIRNIKPCFLQDLHSTQRTNGSTFISARLHPGWGRERKLFRIPIIIGILWENLIRYWFLKLVRPNCSESIVSLKNKYEAKHFKIPNWLQRVQIRAAEKKNSEPNWLFWSVKF